MFIWFAENTIVAGLLVVCVLVICGLFRPRPAVRHALWLLVLVKLVTPPLLAWPWAVEPTWPRTALTWISEDRSDQRSSRGSSAPAGDNVDTKLPKSVAPASASLQPQLDKPSRDPAPPSAEVDSPPLPAKISATAISPATANEPQKPLSDLQRARDSAAGRSFLLHDRSVWPTAARDPVLWLWAFGTAAVCLVQLFRVGRTRRLVQRARPAPGWLQADVDSLGRRLHVRPPQALLVSKLSAPGIWCLGRAKLLWPSSMADSLRGSDWQGVILHELAHLKRRDHWVRWLELAAGCVYWWNPVFWFVRRRLRETAELACDAWVTAELPEARRTYAESLVEVTRLVSATPAVAVLGMSAASKDFERRLTMILRERVQNRVPLGAAVVIAFIALVILPGWTRGEKTDQSDEPVQNAAAADDKRPAEESPTEAKPTGPATPLLQAPAAAGNKRRQGVSALRATAVQAQQRSATKEPTAGAATRQGQAAGGGGLSSRAPAAQASGLGESDPSIRRKSSRGRGMGGRMGIGGMGANLGRTPKPIKLPSDARIETYRLRHITANELLPFIRSRVDTVLFQGQIWHRQPRLPADVQVLELPSPGEIETEPAVAVVAQQIVLLSYDERTGTLVARGSANAVEQVSELHATLDVPADELPESLGQLHVYRLKSASAENIVSILRDLRMPTSEVVVMPLAGGKALVIQADDNTAADIKKVIEALDGPHGGGVPAGTNDDARIQGTWRVISAMDGGRSGDLGHLATRKFVFADGTLTMVGANASQSLSLQYILDPETEPKNIDLINTKKNGRWLGIYKLEGDQLKICFNESDKGGRSTKFVSEPGSPNDVLLVLERDD